ncbi:MAG: Rieske 2Fe-2S domain-containing protein [Candidatus Caldipriscus sp.]
MKEKELRKKRREFLKNLGRILGYGALGGLFAGFGRSLWPNILYEPPKKVRLLDPKNLAEGMNYFPDQRLFVFKRGNEVWAISAVCQHLGCTVNFVPLGGEKWEFYCPCHGSKYNQDGDIYEGPAPRGLPFHPLEIDPATGYLVVDMSREVNKNWRLSLL